MEFNYNNFEKTQIEPCQNLLRVVVKFSFLFVHLNDKEKYFSRQQTWFIILADDSSKKYVLITWSYVLLDMGHDYIILMKKSL